MDDTRCTCTFCEHNRSLGMLFLSHTAPSFLLSGVFEAGKHASLHLLGRGLI